MISSSAIYRSLFLLIAALCTARLCRHKIGFAHRPGLARRSHASPSPRLLRATIRPKLTRSLSRKSFATISLLAAFSNW